MTDGKRTEELENRIERIVRDVLAQLDGERRVQDAASHVTNDKSDARAKDQRPTKLALTGRVITAGALEGRLGGVGEVHVECTAVLTPSARDVLRHAAVRVYRGGRDGEDKRQEACRLIVGVAECAVEPKAAARLAEVHHGEIQQTARTGLVQVVRELTEQVVLGGCKGLLFTSDSAAAVCLANRTRGVRAVAGTSVEDVERDISSVGANLLVIRPAELTTWQQLQMVKTLVACRAACPDELRAALS